MTSSRRLALAKFLKKAKSAKEGGDAVASDVPTVASLPTPPPSASPPPIAAVPLAMASTPAPARPNKGKRVLIVDSDSEDSGNALVSHKRRATGLPASSAASPGGGNSLRDDPLSATSPPPPPAHEEREERIDLVPPPSPLPHRDAAEASGSAPPVSVPGSTSRKPRIPRPIHRELTQGFTEGMSPTDPQKGGGMPYYMGAFLAVAIKWRTQARNAIKGREALRKLRQEVGALKEEKQNWGLKEEASQSLLKLAHEGREGAEAYARELEQAHAAQLAQLTSYQIQNIGLQEATLTSEVQRRKLEELDAAWRQKLGEREDALAAKVEALSLLQAEANKLRVEKEFLEKQLTSKDSRVAELEGEVQELTGEMAGAFEEGFQEALTQASCENPGINISNCDPTHHVVDGKVVPMDLDD
ncbi:chromatin-remodeling ATPase INO80-like [Phaseolus vulgaris]|uniref:chromatin-remodeling ATPase INO80-like n=1 Tax=Phaseolus vulgaris TaxID=3885 RepID=UPI0035C9BE61